MDRELLDALKDFGHVMNQNFFDTLYKKFNITKKELLLLSRIDKNTCGPLSQKDLSKIIHADRSTMVSIVDKLEDYGYICREKNPNNRRENLIILTRKGSEFLNEISDVTAEDVAKVFKDVDNNDLKIFKQVLEKVIKEYNESNANQLC